MDSPELDAAQHFRALRALARVNTLSLAAERIWRRILPLAKTPHRKLRILDVACGGGDVPIALKERSEKLGLELEVTACDVSPVALEFARTRAESRGADVRFFLHDATESELPGEFDLVTSSLFLHHLGNAEATEVLANFGRAGRNVLVQDLRRTTLGYLLAMGSLRVLTGSNVVRVDGPRSVRAAFSLPEVRELAHAAGLTGARINRCWPQRFSLIWEGP
jgi:2-polyprenyl-3-methyl-5-hydroxy-6-metoxy-1,4-benzoquinol methylase